MDKKKGKPKLLWGSGYKNIGQQAIGFCSAGDWEADLALFGAELAASKAHVKMLQAQKLISAKEAKGMLSALAKLEKTGTSALDPAEDIHTSFDIFLNKHAEAGNFRLALSRNDQVVTAEHIYLNGKAKEFSAALNTLAKTLAKKALKTKGAIMAGYTHHQQALPTTFGHLMLAFAYAFQRDAKKFDAWLALHNACPLGAGTSFGTTLPIDANKTAHLLGFAKAHPNSLDAISSRWELEADFTHCLASIMTHLSILAQTLILFSTSEFGYISLGDAHSTGSSAMPQKKNPDVLEAIKGKTAEVQASLLSILSLAKCNMAGYNKESQWGKHEVLEAIAHAQPSIAIMHELIPALHLNEKKMLASLSPLTTSLSLAENYSQKYGVPFKQAKMQVEKAIAKGSFKGLKIPQSDLALWQNPAWIVAHASASGPNSKEVEKKAKEILAGDG
ncbi:MAG: argininosuccinate lyase [Candidatus Burarchaeum sp.]|nr:argininosuccinate lyase [Candidatus Burarchaeum sp.]MDO8339644.1 argininosuccinate lyase [Candidatus Burarchaeum sp.]